MCTPVFNKRRVKCSNTFTAGDLWVGTHLQLKVFAYCINLNHYAENCGTIAVIITLINM